MESGEYW